MNTNPAALRILCYGDSNTWGADPFEDRRFGPSERWTGILQSRLGTEFEIIEEGLCGRTFKAIEPEKEYRSGITHLTAILHTHSPINYVIVMLGTNDLKSTFQLSSQTIAHHLEETVRLIQESGTGPSESEPEILIVCPAPVLNPESIDLDHRLEHAPKQSLELHGLFQAVAKRMSCSYLNAGDFISLEKTDGYHLDITHHTALAHKIADHIKV